MRDVGDRARGGDRRRRSDRADAGGRAGAGGRRRRRSSSGVPARTCPARARAACTRARSRSLISAGSRTGSSRRGRWRRSRGSRGVSLDISDFPTRHPYGLGLWQNHIERILAGWVGELTCRSTTAPRSPGSRRTTTGVEIELSDGRSLRADVSRRLRRRTQPDPQVGRHRVPGLGPDDEQPDRRGRAGRGAGVGHPHRRRRHPWLRPGGVRDPRRRDHLQGQRAGSRHGDRSARRSGDRTHPARPQRGAYRGLRNRLRGPQSHLDLTIHRHGAAGRGLPRADGCCWPATPRTCTTRSAGRV